MTVFSFVRDPKQHPVRDDHSDDQARGEDNGRIVKQEASVDMVIPKDHLIG